MRQMQCPLYVNILNMQQEHFKRTLVAEKLSTEASMSKRMVQ